MVCREPLILCSVSTRTGVQVTTEGLALQWHMVGITPHRCRTTWWLGKRFVPRCYCIHHSTFNWMLSDSYNYVINLMSDELILWMINKGNKQLATSLVLDEKMFPSFLYLVNKRLDTSNNSFSYFCQNKIVVYQFYRFIFIQFSKFGKDLQKQTTLDVHSLQQLFKQIKLINLNTKTKKKENK